MPKASYNCCAMESVINCFTVCFSKMVIPSVNMSHICIKLWYYTIANGGPMMELCALYLHNVYAFCFIWILMLYESFLRVTYWHRGKWQCCIFVRIWVKSDITKMKKNYEPSAHFLYVLHDSAKETPDSVPLQWSVALHLQSTKCPGSDVSIKCCLTSIRISIIKIKQFIDCLIF